MSRRSTVVVGSTVLAVALASSAHAVISPLLSGAEPTPTPASEALLPTPQAEVGNTLTPPEAPVPESNIVEPAPQPEPEAIAPKPQPQPEPKVITKAEPAPAPKESGFGLKLWVEEDPNAVGANVSRWEPTAGLADPGSSLRSAVRLQKKTGTFTDSGAHAWVTGVKGITLNELGFDLRNDGHTGAGAPRFTVITQDGLVYAFSFRAGGIVRPSSPAPGDPANWTRIRFRDQDAYPQYRNQKPWPGFGRAVIKSINIVFDEGIDQGKGYAYVDNVDINGVLIGKPTKK